MSTHFRPLRCVITASTGGAVINACLGNDFFRSLIHSVVSDRPCGATEKAQTHGVPVIVHNEQDSEKFCTWLGEYIEEHHIDYIFSFYTLFYSETFRKAYPDRIINLHPSLLPAFKGNDAWIYVQAYGVRFAGSTVEFIHERMDEGKIILQTIFPWDANRPADWMRHRLFVQQCRSLLQVARWLSEGRVSTDGCRVLIRDASFDSFEFSPALDYPEAIQFECSAPKVQLIQLPE